MHLLRPTVKRDLSLFSVTAWELGYKQYFKEYFGWEYPVIFRYDGARVHFYHRASDFAYFKETITKRLIEDDRLFEIQNTVFCEQIHRLKELKNHVTLEHLREIHALIGSAMAFYVFVVSDAFVKACPESWHARNLSEGILYELDAEIEHCIADLLQEEGLDPRLAHVLTLDDLENVSEAAERMSSRLEGYLRVEGIMLEKSFQEYLAEQGLRNPEDDEQLESVSEVRGACAQPGTARGIVRIVRNREDLDRVGEGDILVAVMTNATYAPAFARAGAVITDEGGITCHAAICARELGIPTITGTRIATRVFREGDIIEVDAANGIARKIIL